MATIRKINRRKGLRAHVQTVMGQLSEALNDEASSKSSLLALRNSLSVGLEQIAVLDDEILGLLDPDDVETDVIEGLKIVEPSHRLLVEVGLRVESLSIDKHSSSSSTVTSSVIRCKLPKIELPIFHGNPLKWQGFWDQFNTSINENESLSDIDKFNYLKRYLSGQALDAVSGLTLSTDNYKEAIGILKERYGNPQVLISAHMDSLIKMSKIKNKDDVYGLRKLYDGVENCIRNLKTLKLDTSGYGCLLIPLLKEKLPDELNMIVARRFGSDVWSLDLLLKYVHDELRACENCSSFKVSEKSNENGARRKSEHFTASNLVSHSDTGNNRPPCVFCGKYGHGPSQCRSVTNIKTRKDIIRKKGKCFVCFSSDHVAKNCTAHYICRKCQGKHHISLCSQEQGQNDQSSLIEAQVVQGVIIFSVHM